MKTPKLWLATCLLPLASACSSTHSHPAANSEADMMEAWAAFMTPGAGHEVLAPRVGRWNASLRITMEPGAPPEETTCTSEVSWVMDGRYLRDVTEGSFQGQPFHGLGYTGYDNLRKVYVGTWIDNMGTGIVTSQGSYDPRTRTFTYTMKSPDVPAGKYVSTRMTERWIDKDHWVMQSFAPDPQGREYMSMEIHYTRAQ